MPKTIDKNYVVDVQGKVPPYNPSQLEALHTDHIISRRNNMVKYTKELGVFQEWEMCEKIYESAQKARKSSKLVPPLNVPTALEIVETKSGEEKKVMPRVVLQARYRKDKNKVFALQKVLEYEQSKAQLELKNMRLLDKKNIYGTEWMMVYFKETYRDIKIVIPESVEVTDSGVVELDWDIKRVVDYRGLAYKLADPLQVFVSENATTIEEASELIFEEYLDYEVARSEFGHFENFKYVVRKQVPSVIKAHIRRSKVEYPVFTAEVHSMRYWNKYKDEYSIVLNGVLLTPYKEGKGGNPNPNIFSKDIPFAKADARIMVGRREFYPKGDVILTKRLNEIKNILINSAVKGAAISANPIAVLPKDFVAKLKKLGVSWVAAGVIEVDGKDEASSTKLLQFTVDINGINIMIGRIDDILTTVTGVDPRALLSSVNETATKTAVRRELMKDRIAAGLKLLENDYLYRLTKISLAILKQYYEVEETVVVDDPKEDNPPTVKVPKMIPIKDKEGVWVEKLDPLDFQKIEEWVKNGMDPSVVNLFFSTEDNSVFQWSIDSEEELKLLDKFNMLPDVVREDVLKTFSASKFLDIDFEEKKGETTYLDVKRELFDISYEVMIIPAGSKSASDILMIESMEKVLPILFGNQFVDQREAIKIYAEINGLDADSLIKSEEKIQQENQQNMMQAKEEEAAKTPGNVNADQVNEEEIRSAEAGLENKTLAGEAPQ